MIILGYDWFQQEINPKKTGHSTSELHRHCLKGNKRDKDSVRYNKARTEYFHTKANLPSYKSVWIEKPLSYKDCHFTF